jgi:hypothetical protein
LLAEQNLSIDGLIGDSLNNIFKLVKNQEKITAKIQID